MHLAAKTINEAYAKADKVKIEPPELRDVWKATRHFEAVDAIACACQVFNATTPPSMDADDAACLRVLAKRIAFHVQASRVQFGEDVNGILDFWTKAAENLWEEHGIVLSALIVQYPGSPCPTFFQMRFRYDVEDSLRLLGEFGVGEAPRLSVDTEITAIRRSIVLTDRLNRNVAQPSGPTSA